VGEWETVNPVPGVVIIAAFAGGGDPDCSDAHIFDEREVSGETFPMVSAVVDVPFKALEKSAVWRSWWLR
jgi:hypothetical protein